MPSVSAGYATDLAQYLKSLRGQPLEASVETLVSYVHMYFSLHYIL